MNRAFATACQCTCCWIWGREPAKLQRWRLWSSRPREGDEVASELTEEGTQALAECVFAVAQRLGFNEGPCELAMVGGLFRAGEFFALPFQKAILAGLPHCRIPFA